tara:strand:+ start:3377 stop:3790 length:414 start_codon:yes stop_codon:yes gene_type:complete
MFEEIKKIKTSKKDIRNFGITIGIVLLVIAGLLFYKEKDSFQIFIYLSGSFFGLGIIFPVLLRPIYISWMIFSIVLGWFMTKLILSLIFYLVITPIGLILKIIGKDLLELKKQEVNESFWNLRNSEFQQNQNYEKQF